MTKGILEMIKNKINETEEKKENIDIIQEIYNDAWKFVLLQFKSNKKYNDYYLLPFLFFDKYSLKNANIYIKKAINLLKEDGFYYDETTNIQALKISEEKIMEFANKNSYSQLKKMPITPFAETRRRK